MDEFAFQRALAAIWEFIGAVNRYVDASPAVGAGQGSGAAAAAGPRCCARSAESLRCPRHHARAVPARRGRARSAAAVGRRAAARARRRVAGAWPRCRAVQKLSGLFPRVDTQGAPPAAATRGGAGRGRRRARRRAITSTTSASVDLRVAEVRRGRGGAEVEEAAQAHRLARRGGADAGGRDRRALRAGRPRRQEGRHRGQPRAGHAHGRGVERHGAGRLGAAARSPCSRSTATCRPAPRSARPPLCVGAVPIPGRTRFSGSRRLAVLDAAAGARSCGAGGSRSRRWPPAS